MKNSFDNIQDKLCAIRRKLMSRRLNAKHAAKKLLDKLPEKASWDDIMYQLYVRQKYEYGITAADRGEGKLHEQVKRIFGSK